MKTKIIATLMSALLASVCFIGCGNSSEETGVRTEPYTIEITAGSLTYTNNEIVIYLAENPTTGYAWSYTTDTNALELTLDEFRLDESVEEGTVGSGGERVYMFEGKSGGTTRLELVEGQLWDGGNTSQSIVLVIKTNAEGNISDVSEEAQ